MIVTGILVTYALGAVLVKANLWPWLSVSCSAVATLFAFLISRMPETPSFLLKHGDEEEARKTLVYLRGPGYDVEHELSDIRRQEEESKQSGKVGLGDLAVPSLYKPLLVSVGLMMNQQFCGVNNIIFYSASIFKQAGSTMDENVATIMVGGAQVAATLVRYFLFCFYMIFYPIFFERVS